MPVLVALPGQSFCKAEGAVYTLELTNKGNGWHPHCHMIILATSQPSQTDLSTEWHKITGDSMVVDCRPILGDPVEGFMEVFKYAVKFSDLTLADNWHAAQILKGKRLLNSFGLFRGVEIPDSLLDEPLDGLPYLDRFYRYLGDSYQPASIRSEGRRQRSACLPHSLKLPLLWLTYCCGNRPNNRTCNTTAKSQKHRTQQQNAVTPGASVAALRAAQKPPGERPGRPSGF